MIENIKIADFICALGFRGAVIDHLDKTGFDKDLIYGHLNIFD